MSNPSTEDRDEVLFEFHRACGNPTADQIINWVRRFPKFANDIRAHAAIIKDWTALEGRPELLPHETTLARARSRALNTLYDAQVLARSGRTAEAKSFEQLMTACGMDVPKLAREFDIARTVLAALFGGRMTGPVGNRLVSALMQRFSITIEQFEAAFQYALSAPRIGHAKSDETPTVILRNYEELIRTSSMSCERKRFWLGED
ncbi:MAG: hypothetical protein AB7G28_02330 [Pirellulales bacterium]